MTSYAETENEVGNTGRGSAQTTHAGDLHMFLETVDKTMLLIMKQAHAMPSNTHNTFGVSQFLIHGCKRVSHEMHDHVQIGINDATNINVPITLIKNYLDNISF